jgi:hypothetical protein
MREIIPFTRIAVFQIDEEMEWNARTGPDHVGKALQSLALGHWRGSAGTFDGGEGLAHGCCSNLMGAMDKQGYQDLCSSQFKILWSHKTGL